MTNEIVLYSYWRSSASWRVRIALSHYDYTYKLVEVDLRRDEHLQEPFLQLNPNASVPVLKVGDITLTQSVAILEHLHTASEETQGYSAAVRLLRIREIISLICCDVHPVQNLRVAKRIAELGGNKEAWILEWIERGFNVLEKMLATTAGKFCVGDEVSIADMCLVPQHYNAVRYGCDMKKYPLIQKIVDNAMELKAFKDTYPVEHV